MSLEVPDNGGVNTLLHRSQPLALHSTPRPLSRGLLLPHFQLPVLSFPFSSSKPASGDGSQGSVHLQYVIRGRNI